VRSAPRDASAAAGLRELGFRIGPLPLRRLFIGFCREVAGLSDTFECEFSPFELSLHDPACGFAVTVSPLRELFLVSIGRERSVDIRVSSPGSCAGALDLALCRYLEAASRARPA
jgi:hypothetical protein